MGRAQYVSETFNHGIYSLGRAQYVSEMFKPRNLFLGENKVCFRKVQTTDAISLGKTEYVSERFKPRSYSLGRAEYVLHGEST